MVKKILIILTVFIGYASPLFAQKDIQYRCSSDFSFLVKNVKQNYAGFQDKTQNRKAELQALTDSISSAINQIHTPEQCTKLLKKWIHFFNDQHLGLIAKRFKKSNRNKSDTTNLALTFRFLSKQTAYIRIPSFKIKYKSKIDSLLDANWNRLLHTRNFIIDIRGNSGGSDPSFLKLLPLLYTDPYKIEGVEILATKDNIQRFVSLLEKDELPENAKENIRDWINKMRGHLGSFVTVVKSHIKRRDTIYCYPKHVVILIDGGVYSSAEGFLLRVRKSKKTVLLGQPTGGAIDYANVNIMELPSGFRLVGIPTSRSLRLPENPIDPHGIPPDIKIPKNVENWISFARGYLSRIQQSHETHPGCTN